jgi:hypothetical protein
MLSTLAYKEYELKFSDLRISTMTTTAQTGVKIDIPKLYEAVPLLPYHVLRDGILKIQTGTSSRGISCHNLLRHDKKSKDKKQKAFFNQATLVVRREVSPLYWKEINVKLFKNGGIQMTGIRSSEMARETLTWLLDHIQTTCKDVPLFEGTIRLHKFQVHLINSDFSIGAPIHRDILCNVLSKTYNLACMYETTIYQGVKTKYFYNNTNTTHPGRCTCPTLCKGNGTGSGVNQCKKVTVSPFQTGEVIIQASGLPDGSMLHIEEAMKFIQGVFRTHAKDIVRKQYILPEEEARTIPSKATKAGKWIPHPTPRHVFTIAKSSLVEPASKSAS